jgi:hypothetical protein
LSKADIVKRWKPDLGSMGFSYKNNMFQLAKTEHEFLQFAISIQRSIRAETYKVNPSIIIRSPFVQFPEQEPLVLGNLRRDGIHLHVTTASWWPPEAMEEALVSLKQHAVPWYQEWSRPGHLVKVLETSISERKDLINVMEPLPQRATAPPWRQPETSVKGIPRKYFYHAAILHYLSGNIEMAQVRTNDWVARIGASEEGERARAIAQLSALKQIH